MCFDTSINIISYIDDCKVSSENSSKAIFIQHLNVFNLSFIKLGQLEDLADSALLHCKFLKF